MSNVMLGFPDYVFAKAPFATVALSGGAWQTGAPLTNLLDPSFAAVARSTNLQSTSTRLAVDMGTTRDVSLFVVPHHNLSPTATYRFTAFTAAAPTVAILDTGVLPVYPPTASFSSLTWGHPSLWTGTIPAEDAGMYCMPLMYAAPSSILCRYWNIEIFDASNPSPYVEVARVFASSAWQPRVNMSYGATLATEDLSILQTTMGGAEFFDLRPKRRVSRFTLPGLTDADAMTLAFDLQTRLGTSGQMFFCHDPADTTNQHRRSFLCRMRTLSPLDYAAFGANQQAFELSEIIA